jgi:hypothetical protein
MMRAKDWSDYFGKRLAEAEKALRKFKSVIVDRGLRVFRHDINGEIDVTAEQMRELESQVEEYRAALDA